MELQAFYDGIIKDATTILDLLNRQEAMDHTNDITRSRVEQFLLGALEANTANSRELTDRNLHAALQILKQQEQQDLADDDPRTQARAKIIARKNRAIAEQRLIQRITKRLTGRIK